MNCSRTRPNCTGLVYLSGVCRDVVHHGVRVAAFGVEVGVGVVFCDAPQAVLLTVPVAAPAVAVRDSKHPDGPLLAFAAGSWKTFIEQVKASA